MKLKTGKTPGNAANEIIKSISLHMGSKLAHSKSQARSQTSNELARECEASLKSCVHNLDNNNISLFLQAGVMTMQLSTESSDKDLRPTAATLSLLATSRGEHRPLAQEEQEWWDISWRDGLGMALNLSRVAEIGATQVINTLRESLRRVLKRNEQEVISACMTMLRNSGRKETSILSDWCYSELMMTGMDEHQALSITMDNVLEQCKALGRWALPSPWRQSGQPIRDNVIIEERPWGTGISRGMTGLAQTEKRMHDILMGLLQSKNHEEIVNMALTMQAQIEAGPTGKWQGERLPVNSGFQAYLNERWSAFLHELTAHDPCVETMCLSSPKDITALADWATRPSTADVRAQRMEQLVCTPEINLDTAANLLFALCIQDEPMIVVNKLLSSNRASLRVKEAVNQLSINGLQGTESGLMETIERKLNEMNAPEAIEVMHQWALTHEDPRAHELACLCVMPQYYRNMRHMDDQEIIQTYEAASKASMRCPHMLPQLVGQSMAMKWMAAVSLLPGIDGRSAWEHPDAMKKWEELVAEEYRCFPQ